MYRIMIVDDEPIEVKSLEYIIGKRIKDVEILPSARSGRDAIEKAVLNRPDIVLMDIHMPGIDGIEAIREIKKSAPEARFIITTAFNYFEYASQAIELNVEDYLLKPIKEEKIVSSIEKVIAKISSHRERILMEMEMKEKFRMSVPYLEKGFITDICFPENNIEEIRSYCRLFEIEGRYGCILALELGERVNGEIKNKIGMNVKSERLYNDYCAALKSKFNCIIGPVMLNRIVVFVEDDGTADEYEQKSKVISSANDFIAQTEKLCPDISIGIGRRYPLDDIRKSYLEAVAAVRYISDNSEKVFHYSDIIEDEYAADDDYFRGVFENSIYRPTVSGDAMEAVSAFDGLFSSSLCKNADIETIKNRCILLVVGFAGRGNCSPARLSSAVTALVTAETPEELRVICEKHITYISEQSVSEKQQKVNDIIKQAQDFIAANYMNEISLDDIAKAVNLSSYYFSHFYKEKTGSSVIDSLIAFRIEKAKQLLACSDISIKEVSHAVGYQDQNYFSKMFRKNTGMTASEFKESIQN